MKCNNCNNESNYYIKCEDDSAKCQKCGWHNFIRGLFMSEKEEIKTQEKQLKR
jgi:hypothetical protein